MRARLVLLGASLLVLVGCGSAPDQYESLPTNVTTTTAPPLAPLRDFLPASMSIPAIGASSSLVPLGQNPDGSHEVPPVSEPKQAGWYEPMSEPGEPGPSIVLGHIDGHGQKGVFYRLRELTPGDEVRITDRSGEVLTFVVSRVASYCKKLSDTLAKPKPLCTGPVFDREGRAEIYSPTPGPTLRLITCGGDLDRSARSYRSNIVAFAELKV